MEVLTLTVFLSLLLGTLFTYLFYRDWNARRYSSAERESLLPLDDERETRRRCHHWRPRTGRAIRTRPDSASAKQSDA